MLTCKDIVLNFNKHLLEKHGFTTAEYNAAINLFSSEEPADKYYACPRCCTVQSRIERHIRVCYKFSKDEEGLKKAQAIKHNDCRRVSEIIILLIAYHK